MYVEITKEAKLSSDPVNAIFGTVVGEQFRLVATSALHEVVSFETFETFESEISARAHAMELVRSGALS